MPDRLGPDERLVADQSIDSNNGRASLVMQSDGNLVLYENIPGTDRRAWWASNTFEAGSTAVMQGDGNLVVSGPSGSPIWASHTEGHPGALFSIQDDGNGVIYGGDGKYLWDTVTVFPPVDIGNRIGFVPGRDGFHFANEFTNYILPFWQTYGRCGGMALAAIDYFLANIPIPTHTVSHLAPSRVPAEGTRLSQYIYDRLMPSIVNTNASRFILGPWVTDENCYWWSTHDEFARLRRSVDSGRLEVLGLWSKQAGNAVGHQVVAYGYDFYPQRVYIYDNNHPDEEMTLRPVSPAVGIREFGADGRTVATWRGFFVHDVYDQANPIRPTYIDLGLQTGVGIRTEGPARVGGRLECDVTVRNYGDYPAGLRDLSLYVRGPDGEELDAVLVGSATSLTAIQPGEQRALHGVAEKFAERPGVYTIGASYLSEQGFRRQLPPVAPGTSTEAAVRVAAATEVLLADRWVDVPERARDVYTWIDVEPGDEVELSALGEIWAGVWGAGRNGPNGWSRVDHNPKFPLHEGAEAHPFSLIGKYGDAPYFFVGEHRARQAVGGAGRRRLYLRTNDDVPGNGNGVFRCRVQAWRQG